MDKLIELLNEYQEIKGSEIRFKRIDDSDFFVCGDDVGLGYETIISKKFGFIQRLVENNKIDFDKLEDNSDWYGIDLGDDCCEVLALLSIQDSPIDFLCGIIKN